MLGFPESTCVNLRIPKSKLLANAKLSATARQALKNQVKAIYWRNKLAAGTYAAASGQEVQEIQIFELLLHPLDTDTASDAALKPMQTPAFDTGLLKAVFKAIPYHLLVILSSAAKFQGWVYVAETLYSTPWQAAEDFELTLSGHTLDAVFNNLVRQIAGGRLNTSPNLTEAVASDKLRQKLLRQITSLERKLQNEPQFNRQIELNKRLRQLKTELAKLLQSGLAP